MKNFLIRTISGFMLFGGVILASYVGDIAFFILTSIVMCCVAFEWSYMAGKLKFGIDSMVLVTFLMVSLLFGFMNYYLYGIITICIGSYIVYMVTKFRVYSEYVILQPKKINRPFFMTMGLVYVGLSFLGLSYIITYGEGYYNVIWFVICVSANDTGAYVFGSLLKGKKLIPSISKNKTWSGFISGIFVSAICSYMFAEFIWNKNGFEFFLIGIFVEMVATFGDLIQSAFKRYVNVKDSGKIIPGHGGVFDRMDSVMLSSIVIGLVVWKMAGNVF